MCSASSREYTARKEVVAEALSLIRTARLEKAEHYLSQVLRDSFEDHAITTLLKYVVFWKERFTELKKRSDNSDHIDYILGQWSTFEKFSRRIGTVDERIVHAFRSCVYGDVKGRLERQLQTAGADEGYICSRIARCYKGLGQYEKALEWLRGAVRHVENRAESLAELGDCYALTQDIQRGKLLLREAFFISPKDVNMLVLESELVNRLVQRLHSNKISDTMLKEWLPVYAVIWGVFNATRELRSDERAALVQKVYALEREFSDRQEEELGARLINCYMHLIDYYVHVKEAQSKIDEILLKMRSINPGIYSLYTR